MYFLSNVGLQNLEILFYIPSPGFQFWKTLETIHISKDCYYYSVMKFVLFCPIDFRCLELWLHALKLRQKNYVSVVKDLLRFAQVFSQMLTVGIRVDHTHVIEVLVAAVLELNRNSNRHSWPGPKDDPESVKVSAQPLSNYDTITEMFSTQASPLPLKSFTAIFNFIVVCKCLNYSGMIAVI